MIAINMKMPKNCNFCRFGMEDGSCRVMPIDYKKTTWNCPSDDRPDWCPLRQVDKLMVEHVFQREDFDRYGKDTVKKYLIDTTGREIGEKIVGDMMCEWESKPIDPEFMPFGTRVRTTVSVVRPEIGKECMI